MKHHVQKRARERYGVDLGAADIRAMQHQAHNKMGVLLGLLADERERWLLKVKGTVMIAIYRRPKNEIATVLPVEYSARRGRR